ncbi:MAG: alpha/beta fold hydrolase [Promethearchaeota archaeon]
MTEIIVKELIGDFGTISYFRTSKTEHKYDILFIHGLGGSKNWFLNHFKRFKLTNFSWIVPDLLGYGDSSKPSEVEAYSMNNQALILSNLLLVENVESLVILAHSMGGPIAISLMELMQQIDVKISVLGLFYMEGNLDINDTFFSSKIAEYSLEEYKKNFKSWLGKFVEKDDEKTREFFNKLHQIGPIPLWASSIDLVSLSKSNQLLPRIQAISQVHNCKVHFIFGEENKGLFTSEKLVKKTELPLIYIPDSGHVMFEDNPEAFWKILKQLFFSLNQ